MGLVEGMTGAAEPVVTSTQEMHPNPNSQQS
jgi:hypothetical protein